MHVYRSSSSIKSRHQKKELYTIAYFYVLICYITAGRNSCLPIGLDSIKELEVSVAPISTLTRVSAQGVESGPEVRVAFTAELYVAEE